MLVEECYRAAPWMFATERTARESMTQAVLKAEFGGRGARPALAAA